MVSDEIKALDNALLFLSSVLALLFPAFFITKDVGPQAIFQYFPIILILVVLPLYVGYMRGVAEGKPMVERVRGWVYLIVGSGALLIEFILPGLVHALPVTSVIQLGLVLVIGLGFVGLTTIVLWWFTKQFVIWAYGISGQPAIATEDKIGIASTTTVTFIVTLYLYFVLFVNSSLAFSAVFYSFILVLNEVNCHHYLREAANHFSLRDRRVRANELTRDFYYVIELLLVRVRILRSQCLVMVAGFLVAAVSVFVKTTTGEIAGFGISSLGLAWYVDAVRKEARLLPRRQLTGFDDLEYA